MPAWALKLAAALVLAMTLTGSVTYVSAHPKNPAAPLQPEVAGTEMVDVAALAEERAYWDRVVAIEELVEMRRVLRPALATPTPQPTPTPSPVLTRPPAPSPRVSASPARPAPTIAATLRPTAPPMPTPPPATAVPGRPTLAPSVRTAVLPPVTRTKVS